MLILALAATLLPLGQIPPGKVVMILQPHHDDHTTDYGMGGVIARFVERATRLIMCAPPMTKRMAPTATAATTSSIAGSGRRHKDPWHAEGHQPQLAQRLHESHPAERVASAIDSSDPQIQARRRARPQSLGTLSEEPRPPQRGAGLAEAYWLAGYANVLPGALPIGLEASRRLVLVRKGRLDWGLGHQSNVAVELNESQVRRKQQAYHTHRNVYANPASARAVKAALAKQNLYVPEFENVDDQQAAVLMEEWHMDWISRVRGKQAGVQYAEDYYMLDEFDHLPGLKDYLKKNVRKRP